MNFKKQLPEWNNPGTKPPQTKINEGWLPSDRPPADWWNWKDNLTFEALKELQENAVHKDEVLIKEPTFNAGAQTINAAIKSPVNVLRIDGKTIVNLVPLFDSGAWNLHANVTVNSPSKATLNATALYQESYVNFPAKENTQYSVKAIIPNGVNLKIMALNASGGLITALKDDNLAERTITSPTGTAMLSVRFYNTVATGSFPVESFSLTEGTQAQPFVANVKGLTNPTIVNETNGTSLVVPTTLYNGEYVEQNTKGELIKYKKRQEKLLDGSENFVFSANNTGYKTIMLRYLPGSVFAQDTVIGVKYNGTILPYAVGANIRTDTIRWTNTEELSLEISNTDSGWGPNYTPTPEEIKAYFLGWKMYEATGGYTAGETYNGTGVKQWGRIGNPNENATNTVPTTQAPINSKWQPYRLFYELATPVQEVIQPYSDLTLEKGENSVKVYAGRIVNEKMTLTTYETSKLWNDKNAGYTAKYQTTNVGDSNIVIRENNKVFKAYILGSGNAYGLTKATMQTVNIDPTASYTVDYEPLYTWEVTAPIGSVQLQYFETLVAVTNELVHDVAKQQDTVKRMLENVVNEEEGLDWKLLTVVGFSTGYASYAKDSNGIVHVRVNINTGVWKNGETIAVLPVGCRPPSYAIITCMLANLSPYSSNPMFNILPDGKIAMAHTTPIANGTSITNAAITGMVMFKAGN